MSATSQAMVKTEPSLLTTVFQALCPSQESTPEGLAMFTCKVTMKPINKKNSSCLYCKYSVSQARLINSRPEFLTLLEDCFKGMIEAHRRNCKSSFGVDVKNIMEFSKNITFSANLYFQRGSIVFKAENISSVSAVLDAIEQIKQLDLKFSKFMADDFDSKLSNEQSIEMLLKRYNASSAEGALYAVVKNFKDAQSFLDLKSLVERHKVNIDMPDPISKKTILRTAIDRYLDLFAIKPLNKDLIKLLLQGFAYLLAKSAREVDVGNLNLITYLTSKLESEQAQAKAISSKESSEIVSEHLQEFSITCFILTDLLKMSANNNQLEKKLSEKSHSELYTLKPMIICENHMDEGTSIFCEETMADWQTQGYKVLAVELPTGERNVEAYIKHCEDLLKTPFYDMSTELGKRVSIHLKKLQLFKKTGLEVASIDPIRSRSQIPEKIQQLFVRYNFHTEISMPLRDQGMFLAFALLAEQHRGAVIANVGANHGQPIIDKFKAWYLSRKKMRLEILAILPYKNTKPCNLNTTDVLDMNLSENHKDISLTKFREESLVPSRSLFFYFNRNLNLKTLGSMTIIQYLGGQDISLEEQTALDNRAPAQN